MVASDPQQLEAAITDLTTANSDLIPVEAQIKQDLGKS
jgi:hypothetical protein